MPQHTLVTKDYEVFGVVLWIALKDASHRLEFLQSIIDRAENAIPQTRLRDAEREFSYLRRASDAGCH
jgi:hypothetical protein